MSMKMKLASLLLLVGVSTIQLFGQGASGTILGTVTDSSGAVVSNAKVVVTNAATGIVTNTQSGSAGDYTVPYLAPGTYKVSVQASGFQRSESNEFTLTVDQQERLNIMLKPGGSAEVVDVQASAVTLDTDNAAVSSLITQKQVEELPLNGRNFAQLILLGEGAVTVGGEQGTMRQGMGNAISINGGRPESNNYTLDGLANTDTALNTPAIILSQDAIQEFKVQGGAYSAEYGFSANQINIVSKSGSNSLHGTVFETFRNDALDAKGHFETKIPELRQNQFGFVVGGPVYLGKLYDGRNKTFWLANYEGWRIRNGFASSGNAPDPAQVRGDFSASGLPAYGSPACSAALLLNQPCMPVDPTTGAPFPGNMIPSSRFSRLAQVTAGVLPSPNANPATNGGNNLQLNGAFPLTSNQQTYRLDQVLGRWGTIFGRGTYSNYTNTGFNGSLSQPVGDLAFIETSKSWTVSHTISIGHNNVNNFRFGYLKAIANESAPAPPNAAVSTLGFTGTFTKFASGEASWPNLAFSQFSSFGGPINAYSASSQPMWEFADSLTFIRGRHTLTVGADYRHWHLVRNLDNDFFGDFSFSNSLISNNGGASCPNATGLCGTGNAIADYLLGYYNSVGGFFPAPLSTTTQAGNPQDHIFNYFAPFVQDDWKATSKLTLNLGLRWDYRSAPYEASNHFFWLDNKNPAGGLCFADKTLSTNGVAPAGNGVYRYCGSNVPHPGSKTPFAPRIGFAYRLFGEKTVVRGGYGIFWDSSEGREIDDSGDLYPYAVRQSLSPAANPSAPKLTDNLFPSFATLGPIDPKSLTFIAVIESDNPLNPYLQQWDLSVEHQLLRNTTVEVNYVGTKGTHLLNRRDIAQPLAPSAADLPFCQADPTDVAHNCPTSKRLPYANFPGHYLNSDWHGYSNYNAGTVKLEHRTASLALTALFTWAKSMDDKSAAASIGSSTNGWQGFMDNHNPRLDYGPSDFSVDHRFVASYVYQLPIGRGKRVLGNIGRAANAVVGGWQLSGVTVFQTGFPYSIFANDAQGLLGTVVQRADQICDPKKGFHRTLDEWFNTACFVNPAPGVYGTTKRNYLRGPGINNWDMGLGKTFAFSERVGLQLRIDTFNTFNHAQYDISPGGLIGSGSGGGNNPGNGLGSSSFGKIQSAAPGRVVQLGGKITF